MKPAVWMLPTLLLGLSAGACRSIPEGHALNDALGRATRRAIDSVVATTRQIEVGAGNLRRLVEQTTTLPAATGRELGRLRVSTTDFVERRIDNVAAIGPNVVRSAGGMLDDSATRVASLPHAPARIGLGLETNVARFRRSLNALPHTLQLDREPFPDDSSPSHATELAPTGRQRSWLERAIDRIGF